MDFLLEIGDKRLPIEIGSFGDQAVNDRLPPLGLCLKLETVIHLLLGQLLDHVEQRPKGFQRPLNAPRVH